MKSDLVLFKAVVVDLDSEDEQVALAGDGRKLQVFEREPLDGDDRLALAAAFNMQRFEAGLLRLFLKNVKVTHHIGDGEQIAVSAADKKLTGDDFAAFLKQREKTFDCGLPRIELRDSNNATVKRHGDFENACVNDFNAHVGDPHHPAEDFGALRDDLDAHELLNLLVIHFVH